MQFDMVVMVSPVDNCFPGINKAGEALQVQAEIAELAIEALRECVLHWLTGLDEIQLDAEITRPEEHRFLGGYQTIVPDNRFQ